MCYEKKSEKKTKKVVDSFRARGIERGFALTVCVTPR